MEREAWTEGKGDSRERMKKQREREKERERERVGRVKKRSCEREK